MRKPVWKEVYERAYDDLSAQYPKYSANKLDRLAMDKANDHIYCWEDMMIDNAKDERMMDEGGGSQAREPKDNVR